MRTVAIVGLGSRGLSVFERLLTLATRSGEPVRIDLIDPLCSGAGVHAVDQPDYLLLNTTCGQVSMFPDAHSVGAAAGDPGPSLYQWVADRGLRIGSDGFTVGRHGRPVRPTDFLPRRVLGEYLGWFLDQMAVRAGDSVQVHRHAAEAVGLSDTPGGGLRFALSDGGAVSADSAFLTTGYTPNVMPSHPRRIATPYPLPAQVEVIEPGQVALVEGFGLSAMDVMSALTVGRGGRFVPATAGELRYDPSGAEPRLLFSSRSGLPCRARPPIVEFGPRYQPVAFTAAAIDALPPPRDFDRDIRPLVLTEMRVAYRRAHARGAGWDIESELAAAGTYAAVVALLDRYDERWGRFDAAAAFDAELRFDSPEAYQKWLGAGLREDLAESRIGYVASPVKAALDILRDQRDQFRYAVDFDSLTDDSLDAFHRQVVPALNRAAVGPQYERHLELLALLDAGLAETPFGPGPLASWDEPAGRWRVESTQLAEPAVREVDWLISARTPLPVAAISAGPLLAGLHAAGRIRARRPDSPYVTGIDVDRDQHPRDAAGRPDRRLWVLGPLCEGSTFYNNLVPSPDTWSRPIVDAHRCALACLER